MSEIREVLSNVLAKDLMSTNVIAVHSSWGVSALARFFLANKISGAPVIDEHEKLVGVVTATDIVEFENISHAEKVAITRSTYFEDAIDHPISDSTFEALSIHANEDCTAESIMTPTIISVTDNDSLIDVAALMSKNNIHRVFVVNGDNMAGVISTMDVLKHLGSL